MKKTKNNRISKAKRIFGVLVAIAVMMVPLNSRAYSVTRNVGGYFFTATSSVTQRTGYAATNSSSPISVTVGAQYFYINYSTMNHYSSISAPQTRQGAISCSFSVDPGYRTVKILANHGASYGSEHWDGTTMAIY